MAWIEKLITFVVCVWVCGMEKKTRKKNKLNHQVMHTFTEHIKIPFEMGTGNGRSDKNVNWKQIRRHKVSTLEILFSLPPLI